MAEEIKNQEELNLVARGAGIFTFGYIFEVIVVFITTIVLTRVLSVADFGLYSLGLVILQAGSIIALFGLNNGALKYISAYLALNDKGRVKGTIIQVMAFPLVFGIFLGIVTYLYSGLIAQFFGKPGLELVIKVFAFGIPLFSLMQSAEAVTRGFKTAKYKVLGEKIIKPSLNFVLVLILYFLGFRLLGAVWAFVIAVFFTVLFLFLGVRKVFPEISFKSIVPKFETKKLLTTSASLMFIWVVLFLLQWTDISMIGYFLTSDKVGIYQVAVKASLLMMMFISAFGSIFAPIISALYHKGEKQKLASTFKTVTRWALFSTLLVFLVLIISPQEIMKIFGSEFVLGASSLIILALGQLVHAGAGSSGYILIMTGRERMESLNDICVLILNVVLNIVLIPKFGILGAAIATAISFSLLNIIRVIEVYVFLKMHPFDVKFLKGIFSAVLTFLLVFPLKYYLFSNLHYFWNLVLTSFIILILFSSFLFLLKFEKEDKFMFEKIKRRLGI